MFQEYRIGRSTRNAAVSAVLAILAGVPGAIGLIDPAAAAAVTPAGIWYTDERESIIKVHPCADNAGDFCGSIVWLKEPTESDGSPKVDKLNPDPSKRSNPMVGSVILVNMSEDGDHWKGHAYNPEDGKLYDITFKVKTDKEANDTADLRGCVLRFLCKTSTFTRASDVPGGEPALAGAGAKKKNKKSAHQ